MKQEWIICKHSVFRKEGEFYMDILKDINSEISKVGEKPLDSPNVSLPVMREKNDKQNEGNGCPTCDL